MAEPAALAATLHDLLRADFTASPVAGSAVGLTEFDDRLDDLSADAFGARDAYAADFMARLDRFADETLDAGEAIDRDVARSVLRGRLILAPFEQWKRDPVAYSGPITGGLF